MRKMLNGKIIDTAQLTSVATRTCARSHGGDAIGDQVIMRDGGGHYYLVTSGWGTDFSRPDDDVEYIGLFGDLVELAHAPEWAMNGDLLDYVEDQWNDKHLVAGQRYGCRPETGSV